MDNFEEVPFGELTDDQVIILGFSPPTGGGKWVTINGRRVFIRDGENPTDAIARSKAMPDFSPPGAKNIMGGVAGANKVYKEHYVRTLKEYIKAKSRFDKLEKAGKGSNPLWHIQIETAKQQMKYAGEQAKSWGKKMGLDTSQMKFSEEGEDMEVKLVELENSNTIRGIEIFAAGKHNGQDFTEKDIDDMIAAFGELDYRPALKVGHTKDAVGSPAYGYVTNLTKVVKDGAAKLMADFESMHDSVVGAIRSKLYDRVSSEIYFNLERGGKKFARALKAVALLGAEVPAVANLVPLHKVEFAIDGGEVFSADANLDVPTQASFDSLEARVTGITNFLKEFDMAKHSKKIAELSQQLEEFRHKMKGVKPDDSNSEEVEKMKKQCNELEAKIAELSKEDTTADDATVQALADANKALEASNKRIAELEAKNRSAEVERLVSAVKVPSIKPAISALYSYALENTETKVAVFSEKDGKKVKEEKSLLEIANSLVEEINSKATKLFSQLSAGGSTTRAEGTDEESDPQAELDRRANALMEEKPEQYKTYSQACTHIRKTDADLSKRLKDSFGGDARKYQ